MATSATEVTIEKGSKVGDAKAKPKRGTRNRGTGKSPKKRVSPTQKRKEGMQTKTFPCAKEPVVFQHPVVVSKYDRQFDRFRLTFFQTTSILGKLGLDDGCEQVHDFILEVIDGVEREMKEAVDALTVQIREETGNAKVPRVGIVEERRVAEVPSYLVRRYLNLFITAERLLDAINYAETFNIVTWRKRTELMDRVKSYLTSPHGMFQSVSQKIKNEHRRDTNDTKAVANSLRPAIQKVLESCKDMPRIEKSQPLFEKGKD